MNKSNQCSLEIADHLSRGEYDWCPEAETRLREQHDRIKELEAHLVKEQEPDLYSEDGFPLWTTPQLKELTDEERLDFTKAYFNIHPDAHLSEQFKIKLYELEEFARAILRKASEK